MERDKLVKELAKKSEEIIATQVIINRLQKDKQLLRIVNKLSTEYPERLQLIISDLEDTLVYLKMETNSLMEQLELSTVLPRAHFSSSELQNAHVVLEIGDKDARVLFLTSYSDKKRQINAGDIERIPDTENYIFDRLPSVLSDHDRLLKFIKDSRKG